MQQGGMGGHIVIADDEWHEPLVLAHSMQESGRLFDKETPDQHAVDDFCLYDELDYGWCCSLATPDFVCFRIAFPTHIKRHRKS
eukprot:6477763-Amphidinium_carterae.1